jgi:hypothetical protein
LTLAPAYDDGTVAVYHAPHAELAAHLRASGVIADAMIVDAPYSERTHAGHDDGTESANAIAKRIAAGGGKSASFERRPSKLARRPLTYGHWPGEVAASFVAEWSPLVRGWVGSLTDHVLAASWIDALDEAGRYSFAPIACVESGSRIRLGGDGPTQWSTWLCVARPSTREFASWGSLPGAYVGSAEPKPWVGGKPVWLIRALVRDYSRPGDLVVDPCCGAGTLGVAVRYEGRRAILGDSDAAAVETTIKRLRGERTKPTRDDFPETAEQPSLFGRDGE